MLRYGSAPFLECSSRGDQRFSPFFARIKSRGNRSIEEIYQASKRFPDGRTGLSIEEAKGKTPVNIRELKVLYSTLWDEYIEENPELIEVLKEATGVCDIFGQSGNCCQATELWRIRNEALGIAPAVLPFDLLT